MLLIKVGPSLFYWKNDVPNLELTFTSDMFGTLKQKT
jgi:hypothetical protein